MRASDLYASKYLNANDLKDGDVTTTMQEVSVTEVGGQNSEKRMKLIVQFAEIRKPMILNKTNADILSKRFGDDTDLWKNRTVTLGKCLVMFNGKAVESIRIVA